MHGILLRFRFRLSISLNLKVNAPPFSSHAFERACQRSEVNSDAVFCDATQVNHEFHFNSFHSAAVKGPHSWATEFGRHSGPQVEDGASFGCISLTTLWECGLPEDGSSFAGICRVRSALPVGIPQLRGTGARQYCRGSVLLPV